MHLKRRTTCRVCGSPELETVLDLGEHWLHGAFVKEGVQPPSQRKIPMQLVRCCPDRDERACGLLQLRHTVPPSILYSDYWYRSSTNGTMRGHLDELLNEAARMLKGGEPVHHADILDIGCNDGFMLKQVPTDWKRVGVDPAHIERGDTRGITFIRDLFPTQHLGGQLFDVITSIAMFYDIEDPVEFARAVKAHLRQDGVWILEVAWLPDILRNNDYSTIVHEHLEYYSLAVLETIVGKVGLKVFRAELNECNGGSIRCYITYGHSTAHDKPEWAEQLMALRKQEFDLRLDEPKVYADFKQNVDRSRTELHSLINKLACDGKKIHVLGASTKGNAILQSASIGCGYIEAASDRNPEKHGTTTLGMKIPIISEEESRAREPDCYLLNAWQFRKEILAREQPHLTKPTQFIFPLPVVEVVTMEPTPRAEPYYMPDGSMAYVYSQP